MLGSRISRDQSGELGGGEDVEIDRFDRDAVSRMVEHKCGEHDLFPDRNDDDCTAQRRALRGVATTELRGACITAKML